MPAVTIGGRAYRIRTWQRAGVWSGCAVRLDNGDRHGPEVDAASQEQAIAAVTCWLEWQAAHVDALDDLRGAERAYHRSVADHAFAGPGSETATRDARRAALNRLEQTRARLDEVRERRPIRETDN